MFEDRCENLEHLPIYYSWNRHCGGSLWELTSRSLTLLSSAYLAVAGAKQIQKGNILGGFLVLKSGSDAYEAATGKRSYAREQLGDHLYDAVTLGLVGYGFFREVKKINYLGNPARDFFTKDPISYERAFKQFSTIEFINEGATIAEIGIDNYNKLLSQIDLEESWELHLERTKLCYE